MELFKDFWIDIKDTSKLPNPVEDQEDGFWVSDKFVLVKFKNFAGLIDHDICYVIYEEKDDEKVFYIFESRQSGSEYELSDVLKYMPIEP